MRRDLGLRAPALGGRQGGDPVLGILAFIASGFEHVVANMTTFSLGLFGDLGPTTWADFGRNLTWVGLGNLVGGAVVVGLAYVVVAGPRARVLPEV